LNRRAACSTWSGISGGDDLADDLVPGNNSRIARREFAFYDVQVGSAHPTGKDPKQKVSGLELWSWNVFDVERQLRDRGWGGEDSGFHGSILCAWSRDESVHYRR
jgi:hypothetical protein